ncbi:MAG: hypothetical protein Q8P57_01890 [Candidatus Pacearchaeota archaeon]|nr:hypothetical protein [Candidatus Pacearchaeota archaeon]
MKKRDLIFIQVLLLVIISIGNVSAQSYYYFSNTKDFVSQGIDSITGVLSPFLENIIGDYSTSEFFFSKVLILILLIIIITKILEKTPIGDKNKKVNVIIALLISVISVRFINENSLFETIFIQYGVLGISITTILPMVIFFYFIHNTKVGTFGRKIFWTIYTITLTAIWISKSSEIPEVANWIYGLTITSAIIFIFFDKTIHSYFGLTDVKKFQKKQNKEAILRAKERIHKLNERLDNGIIDNYEWHRGMKEEENLIKELSKES